MGKERKSPQQKRDLQYDKDHFTFAEYLHAFRRQWRQEKTLVNRQYRRKSEGFVAEAKPEMTAADVELTLVT